MLDKLTNNKQYCQWLKTIKLKIKNTQLKVALSVNSVLLELYWDIRQRYLFYSQQFEFVHKLWHKFHNNANTKNHNNF